MGIRGIDARQLREGAADEILGAIEAGAALPTEAIRMPDVERVDRSLQPAVTVLSAWLAQQAEEEHLDPTVLATRADIAQFLSDRTGRLSIGWRAELVGHQLERLLAGDASIALASGGRKLRLVARDDR
jgi:ribonuclease D